MFKPDEPIESSREDMLGRAPFAEALGKAILSYKETNSVVIGLFGEWGSGKTSVLNMALEHIRKISRDDKNGKPIIMNFNPWNFSEQDRLISQFFKQLSVVLRRVDYADNARKAGERLETYAKFFEPLALIPTVGTLAAIASRLFRTVGGVTKGWANLRGNDLNLIKGELNDLLAKQPNKIIVVIDDIDRLNNTEIRQVFQLVKSLADFPNTTYLLAFDKNVVVNALSKVQEDTGKGYLEKIVQVPFDIPLISKQQVEALLLSQLNELVKDIPEDKWDETYWANIYHSGLKYFFENIRHVKRYINSLNFSFGVVKGEVNPVDFLAITAIQVFLPDLYCRIRSNKDIFSGVFESDRGTAAIAKEQAKKRCDEIVGGVSGLPQDILEDFLPRLFPKLHSFYGGTMYGYEWLRVWRRDGRICSPDVFDIFFRLSIPKDEISQEEMKTILSLAENPVAFAEALLKLNQDGRIIRFLERTEDYTADDIPEKNIEPIIAVLMDTGDLFPEGNYRGFSTDTPMRILRIFYQLSHRFDSQDKRFQILKRAMHDAARSLYTIVLQVSVEGQRHRKSMKNQMLEPEQTLTVNAEQLLELQKLACVKIQSWATDNRLAKHGHLSSILFRWKEWEDPEKVQNFVDNLITSDEGLLDFITAFLSEVTSIAASDYVGKKNWEISVKSIKEFVDLKEIEPRLRSISASPRFQRLDDRNKLAIKTLLDTINGKIRTFS